MIETSKIARRGRGHRRSAWALGAVGALGFAGCQTVSDRAQPAPSPPPPVGVYPKRPSVVVNPPQGGAGVQLASATEPGSVVPADREPPESPIDLGVALRLAGVENPTINLAREAIREAQADQTAARALLLPSVNIGGNFHLHRGNLQGSTGLIRDVNSQSLYLGAGARTLAAETVAFPGVRLFAHLGDAAYEPLAARQRVTARRADANAVQNDTLLAVATAYLELIGAEERVRLLKQGESDLGEVVRLTAAYAKAGQGRSGDANRAAANADLLRKETQVAEEERDVAAARLGRLLNLDPAVRLRTPVGGVPSIRLVPAEAGVQSLIEMAFQNRPEIYARSAEIGLAQVRRRQEATRPFLPTVSVGFSSGIFGGGSNQAASDFGPLKGRTDFDVLAVWYVENLGFGNRARVRRANAEIAQAVAAFDGAKAAVGREVAEAHAQVQAAAQQVETANATLPVAEDGFRLDSERIKQAQGRPIEVLDSFRQLLDARLDVLRAIIAYDTAQFRLFVAVGSTPDAPPPSGMIPGRLPADPR